jgi:hypothetical protein
MTQEIEIELKDSIAVGYRGGGQAARLHIKDDMPGVIEPGRLHQADFADDLRPEMQRVVGVFPGRERAIPLA